MTDLKILTLNVWRYYKWKNRKNKLIKFLKKENADIVLLQEAAYDERLKEKWKNQVEEINVKLKYPFSIFRKLMEMKKWHKKIINWKMFYGFGILSRYPIKHSKVIILPSIEKDKKSGFMHTIVEISKKQVEKQINLINVHFENTDKGSKEQLKQTLDWCKKKKIVPIIAGDFNIKSIEDLKRIVKKDYEISYLIRPYKSFIPTKFSHSKVPITLDYIMVSKKKFKFIKVRCPNINISDHKPIVAELKLLS